MVLSCSKNDLKKKNRNYKVNSLNLLIYISDKRWIDSIKFIYDVLQCIVKGKGHRVLYFTVQTLHTAGTEWAHLLIIQIL